MFCQFWLISFVHIYILGKITPFSSPLYFRFTSAIFGDIIPLGVMIMEDFRKEYLGSGITVFVSEDHTFGTDAVLLSDFAAPAKRSLCCDLGTGCGIIPLLWCKKTTGKIYAVEISEKAISQVKKAVEFNGLQERIFPIHSDLRELKGKIEFGCFNLVTMNPPYTAPGAGIISTSDSDKVARHGTLCSFDDACECASKLLNFGGRLCMCVRPERLCELFVSMRKFTIEPKRLRLVSKKCGSAPWLALVEGKRGGNSGMKVEVELHIYDEKGKYSQEMKEIYADYLLENRGE